MLTLSATRGRLRYYRCHGVKILHDLHIYGGGGGGGKTLFIVRQISGPGSSLPCQDVKALSLRRFMGLHDCPELVSELGALQSSFPPRWKNIGNNTLRFSLTFPEHLLPKEHGKEITDKFLKVTVQWWHSWGKCMSGLRKPDLFRRFRMTSWPCSIYRCRYSYIRWLWAKDPFPLEFPDHGIAGIRQVA